VSLVKDFEFREIEAMALIEESFLGKNIIKYIELNDYRHPVGEYVVLK
jgi:hypothetical protein